MSESGPLGGGTPPRTEDLIDFLAKDSARTAESNLARVRTIRFAAYSRTWLLGAALVLALSYWLLPTRDDLRERLGQFDMSVLFLLWSAATLLPAIKVYSLAFPDGQLARPIRKLARFAALPLALLAIFSLAHLRFEDIGFQFYRESSYLNGGCGMVILVAGIIHASFLFSWIRRGATTSPASAGAWAAVSTASFASFVVQFACANENPIHVFLWHFTPLCLLTMVGAYSARRLLRW